MDSLSFIDEKNRPYWNDGWIFDRGFLRPLKKPQHFSNVGSSQVGANNSNNYLVYGTKQSRVHRIYKETYNFFPTL